MADRSPDARGERYRIDYLKLKRALHDRATGLPALPAVVDSVRGWLEQRRLVGLVHLELVNLELVESIYGWQVFDRAVGCVAAALREAIGSDLPADSLLVVERVAGERFVVFVRRRHDGGDPDVAFLAGAARELAARVEAALAEREMDGLGPRIHVRTGQATFGLDPFYRFERVIHGALTEARGWDEKREQRRELSWGEELRRIIRDRALDVVLQPVVELQGRAVLGHEAFVRGPRDTLFEAPRAMFAVSQRVGSAVALDRACCEAALAAFADGERAGRLFLNVLPESLADGAWRDGRLVARCQSLGLAPADVVFEVSERVRGGGPEAWAEVWAACRETGFGLAVDDVGTGQLSREGIERLRPDYLKLDAEHVRGLERDLLRQELLASLVASAAAIGAAVVVEGVESVAEAETAARLGARYGQGYLFAAPVPARPAAVRARGRGR